jgi:hypothetical protein
MEKECSGLGPVEANSTGGQGARRAVAPSDDNDDDDDDDDDDDQYSVCMKWAGVARDFDQ